MSSLPNLNQSFFRIFFSYDLAAPSTSTMTSETDEDMEGEISEDKVWEKILCRKKRKNINSWEIVKLQLKQKKINRLDFKRKEWHKVSLRCKNKKCEW